MVGVNKHMDEESPEPSISRTDPQLEESQRERLAAYRADRNQNAVDELLQTLGAGSTRGSKPHVSNKGGLGGRRHPGGGLRCPGGGFRRLQARVMSYSSSAEGPTFAIVGGGPAGVSAATTAASLGARVVLIEDQVVGGGAHLWDCIPSKTMAATAATKDLIDKAGRMGSGGRIRASRPNSVGGADQDHLE